MHKLKAKINEKRIAISNDLFVIAIVLSAYSAANFLYSERYLSGYIALSSLLFTIEKCWQMALSRFLDEENRMIRFMQREVLLNPRFGTILQIEDRDERNQKIKEYLREEYGEDWYKDND